MALIISIIWSIENNGLSIALPMNLQEVVAEKHLSIGRSKSMLCHSYKKTFEFSELPTW